VSVVVEMVTAFSLACTKLTTRKAQTFTFTLDACGWEPVVQTTHTVLHSLLTPINQVAGTWNASACSLVCVVHAAHHDICCQLCVADVAAFHSTPCRISNLATWELFLRSNWNAVEW